MKKASVSKHCDNTCKKLDFALLNSEQYQLYVIDSDPALKSLYQQFLKEKVCLETANYKSALDKIRAIEAQEGEAKALKKKNSDLVF